MVSRFAADDNLYRLDLFLLYIQFNATIRPAAFLSGGLGGAGGCVTRNGLVHGAGYSWLLVLPDMTGHMGVGSLC
jgi:hypothetical protein